MLSYLFFLYFFPQNALQKYPFFGYLPHICPKKVLIEAFFLLFKG